MHVGLVNEVHFILIKEGILSLIYKGINDIARVFYSL